MLHKVSVAPMMAYTHRHFRYLARLLSSQTLLYTEMLHSHAVCNHPELLKREASHGTHNLVLQLGGDNPEALAKCAALAEPFKFTQINLNIGCPSPRVQSGHFGACLMRQPKRVAQCIQRMRKETECPITVKTRLGVDNDDSFSFLKTFTETVIDAGSACLILHARKAWLKGLNPKQNRTIPPLDYTRVYQIKSAFPAHPVVINGGIETLAEMHKHLMHVDGVMLGRAFNKQPTLLCEVDQQFYAHAPQSIDLKPIIRQYMVYMDQQCALGAPLQQIIKPMFGLFHGENYGKEARKLLACVKNRGELLALDAKIMACLDSSAG